MAQVLTQVCKVEDYKATTQKCAQPTWMLIETGVLPPLTPTDAFQITAAIWGLWALAWLLRPFVRAMSPRIHH